MDKNNDLSLPTPPEGMYWQVSKGPFGIFPYVSLVKKSKFGSWFDSEVDASWTSNGSFASNREKIEWLAGRILERFKERKRAQTDLEKYGGTYNA